jgi:microsomal epoxide hydrolase
LPLLELLKNKYPDPANLPYHIIVPSLPGYTLSTGPSLTQESNLQSMSAIIHSLLTEHLGFPRYIVQGGDVGSFVARVLATTRPACIACHVNFIVIREPPAAIDEQRFPTTDAEKEGLARAQQFMQTGIGYATEHATRPSTIGLALSASPLALLAWIGEKFLEWSDETPDLHVILEAVTLYWLTDTFPRSIYTYRRAKTDECVAEEGWPDYVVPKGKTVGFSQFPKELAVFPRAWLEKCVGEGGLDFWRRHDAGGHFAALERPQWMLEDVENFVELVKKNGAVKA